MSRFVIDAHVDAQRWCPGLLQIDKIETPEKQRAQILGLNMARLCKVDVEECPRREQEAKYGPRTSLAGIPESPWARGKPLRS